MIKKELTLKKIFIFWIPLAATWLMMSVEGPFLAAVIARLAEPKFNLAAYGVAFSFALIIEAPIIMIMSASTALVKDANTFFKLRNFTYFLNILLTILMLIGLIPAIFYFIAENLIGLPSNVAKLTHIASIILIPWPATIGYRRFYQGILIRNNLTRRVAYGTIIRLFSMSITALVLFNFFSVPGVAVGAAALSIGVTMEAIASKIMVLKLQRRVISIEGEKISYRKIYDFYYPLALTTTIALGVHPVVIFFVGQARMPIESLAVLPVVNSLVFIFRAMGLSYQEVGISLLGDDFEGFHKLKSFAFILAIIVLSVLAFIAFSPVSIFWFETVSGLSFELSNFALLPLQLFVVIAPLSVLISWQRAVLVKSQFTTPITWATIIEVGGIILTLYFAIKIFDLIGAIAAVFALVLGRICANIYLHFHYKKTE
jgi:Na+-driven multidrug efflux pump